MQHSRDHLARRPGSEPRENAVIPVMISGTRVLPSIRNPESLPAAGACEPDLGRVSRGALLGQAGTAH